MGEKPKALVFDYDGVLAETERLHWKSWAEMLLPYDLQLSWEDYCRLWRGVSDGQIFALIQMREPRLPVDELKQQNLERRRKVCRWSLAESPIPAETIRLLGRLNAYRIGLVTSSERADVEPVLRACAIYEKFDALVFGSDAPAHKPAPDPYLVMAKKLGVSTGIAFEDSESGLESARAAGFIAVRVEQPGELAQVVARSLRDQAAL